MTSPDTLLDALVESLRKTMAFDVEDAFSIIRSQGRSLELTEDRFWQMGYGSNTIHLLFNLWYRDFNHLRESYANLEQKVEERTQELAAKSRELEVVTLDAYADAHLDLGERLFLKIDTQGHDLEVFAGARLSRSRSVRTAATEVIGLDRLLGELQA
jgi:FkbM family methyltransferase